MPFKDKAKRTEYMRKYRLKRKISQFQGIMPKLHGDFVISDEALLQISKSLIGKPITLNNDTNQIIGKVISSEVVKGDIVYTCELNGDIDVAKAKPRFYLEEVKTE